MKVDSCHLPFDTVGVVRALCLSSRAVLAVLLGEQAAQSELGADPSAVRAPQVPCEGQSWPLDVPGELQSPGGSSVLTSHPSFHLSTIVPVCSDRLSLPCPPWAVLLGTEQSAFSLLSWHSL